MKFEIVTSSPEAIAASEKEQDEKYPFEELDVNQSFRAQTKDVNKNSLRTLVYQRNKRNSDKQFSFIEHKEMKICEVARVL